MVASVVVDLVSSALAKRFIVKNVSNKTYLVKLALNLNPINKVMKTMQSTVIH